MIRTLLFLLLPAALLFLITMAVASFFGATTRGDKKAINAGVVRSLPYVLIVNHAIVFVVLFAALRAAAFNLSSIGLGIAPGQNIFPEILIGLAAGLVLYAIGRFLLDPLSALLHRQFGGYRMDHGEREPASRIAWFIAAVLFAAVVEESVFRGYAVARLAPVTGLTWAIVISSIFFGLLHWAYGFWGMLTTAIMGALFALLFVWRQSLVAPIIAHALCNLINLIVKPEAG